MNPETVATVEALAASRGMKIYIPVDGPSGGPTAQDMEQLLRTARVVAAKDVMGGFDVPSTPKEFPLLQGYESGKIRNQSQCKGPAVEPLKSSRVDRNGPCRCGSGRKTKKCCGELKGS